MSTTGGHDYFLGHSAVEIERLALQDEFYRETTAELLRRAGLAPGMRVLDIGCGGGDVSMLAAELVGPSGAVHGIDGSTQAIAAARTRAQAAGLRNVSFAIADFDAFVDEARFDALIGRFVLMYLPEPVATLRRLMRNLRPGGIVAFQEMDMRMARSHPHAPLFHRCIDWYAKAIELGGFESMMGSRLFATFRDAGLAPRTIAASRVEGGAESIGYALMAANVGTMFAMLERHRIVSKAEVGLDTLAERLRREAVDGGCCLTFPLLVGAWSRVAA